tara:strand:- start:686 stop:916 length:231 start_codon:yes stop_codon:yes gene_type:complete
MNPYLTPDRIISAAQSHASVSRQFADDTLKTLIQMLRGSDRPHPPQVLALASQYVHHAHTERVHLEVVRAMTSVTE